MNTTVKPGVNNTQRWKVKNTENNPELSGADNEENDDTNSQSVMTTKISTIETCAAAQTRSVGVREELKLLKINEVMGSEELEAQQIASDTLEKNRRLMEKELVTAQMRNQRPYSRRFRHRRLRFGDSVLLGKIGRLSCGEGRTKLLEG